MRFSKALLITCLFFSSPATPQIDHSSASDAQALLLANKANLALTGGKTITDVTLTGTARRIAGSTDETGPVVLKVRGRGESRLELNLPSGQRVEVRALGPSGPSGVWKAGNDKAREEAAHNALTEPAWFFPAAVLASASAANVVAKYAGAEAKGEHLRINAAAADVAGEMRAVIRKLTAGELYLDPVTSLPTSLSFNIHPDDDYGVDIPIEIKFSDYRNVNGVMLPFSVKRYLNGGLTLEIFLEHAAINSGLPDSDFSLQ